MKRIICTSLISGFLTATLAGPVSSATSSATPPVVAPRTGIPSSGISKSGVITQPGTTPQTGVTTPNGVITTQPGFDGQPNVSATISNAPMAANTNAFNGTNSFAGTNGNNFNGTNDVTAIVNPMTNTPVAVNSNFNGNVVVPDQAFTPSDRILLTTLSQGVRASLGVTPNGDIPVHFLIQNGTVTVVGTVQSTQQSQAVLSQVQQTPGVVSVINDLHVKGAFAPAVQPGATTSLLGTPTDRAFSAGDQTLLTTIQQAAAFQLGVTTTSQMPVHFTVQNGVVGVTGKVRSAQEKQALISSIQRTPGIVRVVDNVSVVTADNTLTPTTSNGSVGNTASPANPGNTVNNGVLTPTGNQSSNLMGNTNSSGF